jgi:hypothetical protein
MRLSRQKLRVVFILYLAMTVLPASLSAKSNRPRVSPERLREGGFIDGTYPGNWNDTARISQNFKYRRQGPQFSLKQNTLNADQGNIAVIEDDGSVIFPANHFDLDNSNIRFTPSGSAYTVTKIPQNFDPAAGAILVPGTVSPSQGQPPGPNLSDDDATQVPFSSGFTFNFFGQTYTSVFVGSDGYLTFTSGDATSDDRDLVRFLSRQPRIGPLFADLEPGCGTGDVRTLQRSDRFIAIWNDIPNFSDSCSNVNRDHNTFEVVLFANGSIEFSFNGMGTTEGIVGIAPGNNGGKPPSVVDYTTLTTPTLEFGVIFEFFSTSMTISRTALAEKFYETHGDDYDFITFLTNFSFNLGGNAFAFEENVSNDATGLGALPVFQPDPAWGTKGRLRSFLTLGPLSQYPTDPNQIFLGTNSTVEVIGQEFGHRWMSFVDIPGATCDPTTTPQTFVNTILGRDCAHWSFFFNSDGSVMEGNDIQDNGNGTFTTKDDATSKYSDLDQYLMGLKDQSEVSPTFAVFNPTGSSRANGSSPDVNITFGGTRHTVTVNDIMTGSILRPDGSTGPNGLRTPTPATSQKAFRQAWILLVQRNTTPSAADVARIDTIRQAWQSFFSTATNGRGSVDTTLVSTVFSAQLPASGGVSKISSGQGQFASVSYGQVTNPAGPPPVGLAIFAQRQSGALVTEAGVPAVAASTSSRVFVDFDAANGRDSGVALVNPGTTALTVNLTLRDQNGVSSSCPAVTVPPLGKIAQFASQFSCSALGSSFLGTLTFTASAPFAAVNLRSAPNDHPPESIFSALPVVDPTVTPVGSNLIFSQILDGNGNPTQILLMNTSGSTIAGTILLFRDSGTPALLDFGSGPVSSLSYSISANGMQKFSTTGQGGLKVAYAVVTPTSGQLPAGAVIFAGKGATGASSQAGVLNAIPTTNARVYIERSSVPLDRDTGIALVNRNPSTANVTLHLVSLDGSFNQTTTINVDSNIHLAAFIEQLFASVSIPSEFKGVLTIQSNQPLALVTLRLTHNERGEEIYSTLPVADLNNPPVGPLFIPQVVDGGGFTTQIILINTSNGGETVGITFISPGGSTVVVPFS